MLRLLNYHCCPWSCVCFAESSGASASSDEKACSLDDDVGLFSEDASTCGHSLLPLLELHCSRSNQHLYDSYLVQLLLLEPESMIKLLLRFLEYCCCLCRNKKQKEGNKMVYPLLPSSFLPVFPCGRT